MATVAAGSTIPRAVKFVGVISRVVSGGCWEIACGRRYEFLPCVVVVADDHGRMASRSLVCSWPVRRLGLRTTFDEL